MLSGKCIPLPAFALLAIGLILGYSTGRQDRGASGQGRSSEGARANGDKQTRAIKTNTGTTQLALARGKYEKEPAGRTT
jgi:hypothetical protein